MCELMRKNGITERYVQLIDYPRYAISNYGQCKNILTGRYLIMTSNSYGYAYVKLRKDGLTFTRSVHSLVANTFLHNSENKLCVDHINHKRTDNSHWNLRYATHQENSRNQSKRSDNRSGKIGISFKTDRNKWRAQIRIDNKNMHLGYFSSLDEAIQTRKEAEIKYFGEFANSSESDDEIAMDV